MMAALALGTVQFGLPYGVANQTGRVTQEPVKVQPATVSKDHIAALLKAAEATKRSLDEAQKTNDAVISALKALHK